MLSQKQVDLAWREIRKRRAKYLTPSQNFLSKLDQEVADIVGCGASTVSKLRRGVRIPVGVPAYRRAEEVEPTSYICPNCGPVIGSRCVLCYVRELNGHRPECPGPVDDGPGPGDPTPEQIKSRAALRRALRELGREEVPRVSLNSEELIGMSLWVDPEYLNKPVDDNEGGWANDPFLSNLIDKGGGP